MINFKDWQAAFLMTDGRIIPSGKFHDAHLLPNGVADLEHVVDGDGGWVDPDGRYWSRKEAEAIKNSPKRLESQDFIPQDDSDGDK